MLLVSAGVWARARLGAWLRAVRLIRRRGEWEDGFGDWKELDVMRAWDFTSKTNLVWSKIRKNGGPDGRCMGFYYRNVTVNLILLGVRGA